MITPQGDDSILQSRPAFSNTTTWQATVVVPEGAACRQKLSFVVDGGGVADLPDYRSLLHLLLDLDMDDETSVRRGEPPICTT